MTHPNDTILAQMRAIHNNLPDDIDIYDVTDADNDGVKEYWRLNRLLIPRRSKY